MLNHPIVAEMIFTMGDSKNYKSYDIEQKNIQNDRFVLLVCVYQ